jgi:hypothetical protein
MDSCRLFDRFDKSNRQNDFFFLKSGLLSQKERTMPTSAIAAQGRLAPWLECLATLALAS